LWKDWGLCASYARTVFNRPQNYMMCDTRKPLYMCYLFETRDGSRQSARQSASIGSCDPMHSRPRLISLQHPVLGGFELMVCVAMLNRLCTEEAADIKAQWIRPTQVSMASLFQIPAMSP
jgi:hypothetical protein